MLLSEVLGFLSGGEQLFLDCVPWSGKESKVAKVCFPIVPEIAKDSCKMLHVHPLPFLAWCSGK